jgi:hypothetical protein
MSALWIVVIGASIALFALRYSGYLIPEKYLTNPRVLRINTLIPIVLMSAMVGVQSVTEKGALVIDQRLAGIAVAVVALMLKAPYFVVMISAALTSALIYRF